MTISNGHGTFSNLSSLKWCRKQISLCASQFLKLLCFPHIFVCFFNFMLYSISLFLMNCKLLIKWCFSLNWITCKEIFLYITSLFWSKNIIISTLFTNFFHSWNSISLIVWITQGICWHGWFWRAYINSRNLAVYTNRSSSSQIRSSHNSTCMWIADYAIIITWLIKLSSFLQKTNFISNFFIHLDQSWLSCSKSIAT